MILAIDIGGTFIKFGLVDDDFSISNQSKEPTPSSLDNFWITLESIISSFKNGISGIAIACPGEINSKHGFVFKGGLIPYLTAIPLGTRLSKTFQLPVKVINDADAAALAEARYGSLQDIDCGAALVLGTGVGLGLVSQGALLSPLSVTQYLRAPSPQSMGQTVLPFQLGLFKHALFSLVDNKGSAVGFVHEASQILGFEQDDGLAVFSALDENHSEQLNCLFKDYCHEIAVLILNLQSFFKLDRVVIGGGISSQNSLIEGIVNAYEELFNEKSELGFEPITIQACHFHNDSNLLGAASYFASENAL
ncbi:ROK family protein [Streptococcus salivarius]|uniref:ROK family protein n=1 Tax=Streptococcus salivarius TaxID=1304 RepID=UPI00019FC57C|nr:ROK family protein [Streptococcus salivarius]EEK10712.1 ROK family protein [Streptococcus salivarius SK126]QKH69838.1 ROK family protein [Streptococcus salivarius]